MCFDSAPRRFQNGDSAAPKFRYQRGRSGRLIPHRSGASRPTPLQQLVATDRRPAPGYFWTIFDECIATHCQRPSFFTQVSVHWYWPLKSFPFS